jgi:hypothetical protein
MSRQKTKKHSAILFVVCEGTILMQIMQHQGGDIVDVFGSFMADGDDAQELINKKVIEMIGEGFDIVTFGKILNFIEKPSESVELSIDVFKITMTRDQKVSYKLPSAYIWADVAFIRSDPRIRNADRVFLEKALEDRELNMVIHEEQYEKWISAKLISWEDKIE